MRFKQVGNKADIVAVVVHNGEASVAIPNGAPVCLELDGTNDGLDVVLPATIAANATGALFGVALGAIANGAYGEAQVFGFCNNLQLLASTRAATTDSWSTNSFANALILCVDTVNNVFSTTGGTQAKSGFSPNAVMAQSLTVAGSASSTANALTANIVNVKAFLRLM